MDQSAAPWRVLEEPSDREGEGKPTASGPLDPFARTRWLPLAAMGLAAILGRAAFFVARAGSRPSVDVSGAPPIDSGAARSDAPGSVGAAGSGVVLVDV